MAAEVKKITLGIDVSKASLDVYRWDTQQHVAVVNEPKAIRTWLKSLSGMVEIAIEPTSRYHLEVIDQAHARGHEVYLVNPRQLAHYRLAVGERNKTDPTDAWLLARFVQHERTELRVYTPLSGDARRLWSLIKRRATVVSLRQQLRLSMSSVGLSSKAADRSLGQLIVRIDAHLARLIARLGWSGEYQRAQTIPGIGPVNAAALVAAYHRGAFASANAFIAYLGLDVRQRESGTYRGKRKLTKHGEPELRRLLWCAAQPARCYAPFEAYLEAQLAKGLSKTAAKVVLARKLARIAFAILRDQTTFTPQEA